MKLKNSIQNLKLRVIEIQKNCFDTRYQYYIKKRELQFPMNQVGSLLLDQCDSLTQQNEFNFNLIIVKNLYLCPKNWYCGINNLGITTSDPVDYKLHCDQLDENDCQLSKRCKMNQDQCQFKSCQDYLITECNYIQDCILENNKCIDHVWGRCADIPIEVCELNENCAINNENKCEEFTRCEDYQMNGNEDCNKKNENCYNGKEGYCKSKIQIGNCQQVEMECEMYKIQNKQYCVASTDNKCISIQVTQCSNMNGTPACSLYNECDWNISTSICREKRCNDLDEQNCNGELKNLNGETMICYWENGQCLKMQSRDDLSQSNCYLATIGQSTWKEGKCQECIQLSQLVILIYYLIYIL